MKKSLLFAGLGMLLTSPVFASPAYDAPQILPDQPGYIRVGDAVINSQPGSTTCITRIDANGVVTNETVTMPETEDMILAKKRLLEEAENTYTITVNSVADSNGNFADPDIVYVMRDQYYNWRSEHSSENVFTLPEGSYCIQVVYGDEEHSNVFIPNIELTEDLEFTVSRDMADKTICFRMYMPDGSPMILPVDGMPEIPYNTAMVTTLQSTLVNGCSQWTHSITCSIGGENFYKNITLKSNFGEDTMPFWLALTYATTFGNLGISTTRDGAELTDGEVISNDFNNYFHPEVEFQHTPVYAELGEENNGLCYATDLHRPDNAVLVGLAITVWDPHGFYVCTDLNDLDSYHTLAYVKDVDQYNKYGPKWGVNSPMMVMEGDRLMYICSQEESKYNVAATPSFSKAPYNPYFSFPYDAYSEFDGGTKIMGNGCPYASTYAIPQVIGDYTCYNYDIAAYFGNYGENRQVDAYNFATTATFNGEPIDFSAFRSVNDWINAKFMDGHEPGVIAITYTDDNARLTGNWSFFGEEGLPCVNTCTISYTEETDDMVPPTIQRIMIFDSNDTPTLVPTNMGGIGKIAVAGGDFHPETAVESMGAYIQSFTTYTYAPATLKVEFAENGTDEYAELEMVEDPDKYVESYGAYWEGELNNKDLKEMCLYDLRITMEDAAGNTQVQTMSPAFYVMGLPGVKGLDQDVKDQLTLVDGKIVSAAGRDVTVFNLSGARVSNADLAPGVYVATSGAAKTKVIVK